VPRLHKINIAQCCPRGECVALVARMCFRNKWFHLTASGPGVSCRDLERTRSFAASLRQSGEQRLWTAKYDNAPRCKLIPFAKSDKYDLQVREPREPAVWVAAVPVGAGPAGGARKGRGAGPGPRPRRRQHGGERDAERPRARPPRHRPAPRPGAPPAEAASQREASPANGRALLTGPQVPGALLGPSPAGGQGAEPGLPLGRAWIPARVQIFSNIFIYPVFELLLYSGLLSRRIRACPVDILNMRIISFDDAAGGYWQLGCLLPLQFN
jgi:hypothetical protein